MNNRTAESRCRICGKTVHEIGGYLHRVNEKGVVGIWECRPSCGAKLSNSEAILAAIEGENGRNNRTASAELSSVEFLARVSELEKECIALGKVLEAHGQWIASYKMDDAVEGLHKVKSCWNDGIKWERAQLAALQEGKTA